MIRRSTPLCRVVLATVIATASVTASAIGGLAPPSDQLTITDATGSQVFSATIAEDASSGVESGLAFTIGVGSVSALAAGSQTSLAPLVTGAVALLEPVGEASDPGVGSVPIQLGATVRDVSDLVLSINLPGTNAPTIALISDGDPALAGWVNALTTTTTNSIFRGAVVQETGGLQDVTADLDPAIAAAGYKVQVASDIAPVPEPATWTSLLAGLALAAGMARRRRD